MTDAPNAVLEDVLNSLLEAEQGSIFRFMGQGSPYLGEASPELRHLLAEIMESGDRRAGQLAREIQSRGGTVAAKPVASEEQYLAYLSLKFLLPKLVEAKKLLITRYENAAAALQKAKPPAEIEEMLQGHMKEHRAQLAALEMAAEEVARAAGVRQSEANTEE